MAAQPADNTTQPPAWVPDANQFSSRLAALRHAMGWNAKEAALACGIAAQSWREWEDGREPRRFNDSCQKIAQRTGCDIVWLKSGFIKPGIPELLPRMGDQGNDDRPTGGLARAPIPADQSLLRGSNSGQFAYLVSSQPAETTETTPARANLKVVK